MRKGIPKRLELSHIFSYLSTCANCAAFGPDSAGCDLFAGGAQTLILS